MSLTYGYDLKDRDKILEAPVQASKILGPLILPGATLVNHLPFCAVANFAPPILVSLIANFQYGTFLHGFHTSATNHWRE